MSRFCETVSCTSTDDSFEPHASSACNFQQDAWITLQESVCHRRSLGGDVQTGMQWFDLHITWEAEPQSTRRWHHWTNAGNTRRRLHCGCVQWNKWVLRLSYVKTFILFWILTVLVSDSRRKISKINFWDVVSRVQQKWATGLIFLLDWNAFNIPEIMA